MDGMVSKETKGNRNGGYGVKKKKARLWDIQKTGQPKK